MRQTLQCVSDNAFLAFFCQTSAESAKCFQSLTIVMSERKYSVVCRNRLVIITAIPPDFTGKSQKLPFYP